MNRTFGGLIVGEGLQSQDSKTLKTAAPLKKLHLRVHALTAQTDTEDEWLAQLEKQRAQADAVPLEKSRAAHQANRRLAAGCYPGGDARADRRGPQGCH